MPRVEIEVKGAESLIRVIGNILRMEEVKGVVKEHTGNLQRTAKRKAVFTRGYSTGHLRRNITLKLENNGLSGRVKADTEYSGYVEKGTRKMAAQPFMEPALEAVGPDFIRDLKEVMR